MSCSNEEDTPAKNDITIQVFYKLSVPIDEKKPDSGAKVFVYYGKNTYDFMRSDYIGEGIFQKADMMIRPDQSSLTDDLGQAVLVPQYTDRMLTIVIESNRYSPRLASEVFPSAEHFIHYTYVFLP